MKVLLNIVFFGLVVISTGCASIPPIEDHERENVAEYALIAADLLDVHIEKPNDLHPEISQTSTLRKKWVIDGYIIGDNIASITSNGMDIVRVIGHTVMYGVLAHESTTANEPKYLIAIRGTGDFTEWKINAFSIDNLAFDINPNDSSGAVSKGFYSVYKTLKYMPIGNDELSGNFASIDLAKILANKTVIITGHSLGAALATYLTAELTIGSPSTKIEARFIASPRTGNPDFVNFFDRTVSNYLVINISNDPVPQLPPSFFGLFHKQLKKMRLISPDEFKIKVSDDRVCLHHAVVYSAVLEGISSSHSLDFWRKRLHENASNMDCIPTQPLF